VLTLCLYVVGPKLILLVFGNSYVESAWTLYWLAPLPFAVAIGSVFANLVMLPAGQDLKHLLMTSTAGLLNVLILIRLAHMGAIGAAIALLVAECFVALFSFLAARHVLARCDYIGPHQ
jgi:O-antigen/teichoic acid export membrane protein